MDDQAFYNSPGGRSYGWVILLFHGLSKFLSWFKPDGDFYIKPYRFYYWLVPGNGIGIRRDLLELNLFLRNKYIVIVLK